MRKVTIAVFATLALLMLPQTRAFAQCETFTYEQSAAAGEKVGYTERLKVSGAALKQFLRAFLENTGQNYNDEQVNEMAVQMDVLTVNIGDDTAFIRVFLSDCNIGQVQVPETVFNQIMKTVEQNVSR